MCRTSKRDLAASCCCCAFFFFSYKSLFTSDDSTNVSPSSISVTQSTWSEIERKTSARWNQNLMRSLKPSAKSAWWSSSEMSDTFHHFWALGVLEKLSQHIGDWMSEWLRLNMSVSVGVWKCVQAYVWFAVCVCGPVQNKSGHSSAELACAQHIRSRKERQAFIFAQACRDPIGDHMPESGQESFCVINTQSLGVPRCQGLRYWFRDPNRELRGSQWNLSKAQITICHGGRQAKNKTSQNPNQNPALLR